MSKKSSSKAKSGVLKSSSVPPISAEESELIALRQEANRLHLKAKIEELDFNEFQSQREKLEYFWLIEKELLDQKRNDCREKDNEIEDLKEQQLFEIKSCEDNLKALLHEQQIHFSEKLTSIMSSQKEALYAFTESMKSQKLTNVELETVLRAVTDKHSVALRSLRRTQEATITDLRHEFEKTADDIRCAYDLKLQKQREDADKRRRIELKQIKDEKEDRISRLLVQHKKEFDDLKISHHGLLFDNLETIKSLKSELRSLEEEERQDEVKIVECESQINRISGPLERLQISNKATASVAESYQQEKVGIQRMGESVSKLEKQLEELSWEHESLLQRVITQKAERDTLKQTLTSALFDIKQKTSFRTLLLEKKLKAIKATSILPEINASMSLNV